MTQMNRRPAPRPAPGGRPAPQQRQSAPGRPARRGGGNWRGDVIKIAIGGLIVAVLAFMLQSLWPNGFPLVTRSAQSTAGMVTEIHSSGPLRINEIMTSNRHTLSAEDGTSPDWLEVANVGNSAVNLAGYALAKSDNSSGTFKFPDMTLDAGECVLVLADSRLRADEGEALHAPFRLSSSGDTLMLFSPSRAAIDTVNIPALTSDSSYARTGDAEWEISFTPTPGLPNDQASYLALTEPSGDSDVIITEIVASNNSALADENGEFYDYIELYNRSSEAVNLTGWNLSDDATQARKWSFPEVSIAPGEYLVVYASGLDRKDDPAHLHTNFSLSSEGEQVALSNAQGRMMDKVEYDLLKSDTAWALDADGSWKVMPPTPGRANS